MERFESRDIQFRSSAVTWHLELAKPDLTLISTLFPSRRQMADDCLHGRMLLLLLLHQSYGSISPTLRQNQRSLIDAVRFVFRFSKRGVHIMCREMPVSHCDDSVRKILLFAIAFLNTVQISAALLGSA